MNGLPALLVEAFSEEPLGGNGAAVVRLAQPAPAAWMQRVAAQLRQSETAFLWPHGGRWALRWFTPSREVPLCGHGTLAALLALGHWNALPIDQPIAFLSRSGPLQGRLLAGGPAQFPHPTPQAQLELPHFALEPMATPPQLGEWLSERLRQVPERFWHSSLGYHVALVPPSAPLSQIQGVAESLTGPVRQGLVVMQALPPGLTAGARVAGERADYQLRFFAPGLGIAEDPVTGSAHALVAPFWMEALQRPRVVGWQCSDRPGGMVCEAASSGMIRLTGSGHLLWEGTLRAEPERCSGPAESFQEWRRACGL